MKIILNETNYVTQILSDENSDIKKISSFLKLYARYLYHEKGLRKTGILRELDAFMRQRYPDYRPADWSDTLERYAAGAGKYPLCNCDGIWITQKELDTIRRLQNKVLERLAFTLLCLAKFGNFKNPDNHGWVNYSNSEIYSLACITASAFDKDMKLATLKDLGLIAYAKKVNSLSIQVLFLEEDGTPALWISDFRKLGYEWNLYKGEPYIRCAACGILVRKDSNRKKYCRDCAKISTAHSKFLWDVRHKIPKSEI